MALWGSLSTIRGQLVKPDHFSAAFSYLDECLRPGSAAQLRLQALAPGETERIELPGGSFAMEQVYYTKSRSEGVFESHRAYIDLQAVIAGEEWMEVADIGDLQVKEDLTPSKDVILYEPFAAASLLRVRVGGVAVFFPVDAHKPCVAVEAPELVRKTVIKVPVWTVV